MWHFRLALFQIFLCQEVVVALIFFVVVTIVHCPSSLAVPLLFPLLLIVFCPPLTSSILSGKVIIILSFRIQSNDDCLPFICSLLVFGKNPDFVNSTLLNVIVHPCPPSFPFFPCIIAQCFFVALFSYANWLFLSYLPLLFPHLTCLSLWTGCDFNFELCLSNFLSNKHCTTGSSFVSVQVCVCPITLAATALCCPALFRSTLTSCSGPTDSFLDLFI